MGSSSLLLMYNTLMYRIFIDGWYVNTLDLNTVIMYFCTQKQVLISAFLRMYLSTVLKYFLGVLK